MFRGRPHTSGTGRTAGWYPTRTTIGGVSDVASSSGPALYEDLRPGADSRYSLGAFHSVWHRGSDGVWRVLFDDGIEPKPAIEAEVAAFRAGRKPVCPKADGCVNTGKDDRCKGPAASVYRNRDARPRVPYTQRGVP